MIRRAGPADFDFLLSVARERYPPFDARRARAWYARIQLDPDVAALRSDHGFVIGHVVVPFHGGPARAAMLFLACRRNAPTFEGVRLLRALDDWRRARGAKTLHFGSEDTAADLSAIAKRIGARVERPSYVIEGGPVAEVERAGMQFGSPLIARALERL